MSLFLKLIGQAGHLTDIGNIALQDMQILTLRMGGF
jgi:hypothetical protein